MSQIPGTPLDILNQMNVHFPTVQKHTLLVSLALAAQANVTQDIQLALLFLCLALTRQLILVYIVSMK